MNTNHKVIFGNAIKMKEVLSESIDLMVTSPPYPMIEMWDEMFAQQSSSVKKALQKGDGLNAFELMHQVLDPVWKGVYRVLKVGSFACINIGDATRTINGNFVLYPNHMRILKAALELGFSALPCILWRKQTNAPNKFMGSGMLPAGAYVTLEHEYILILRKGPKREFKKEKEKKIRLESAIFWEERNSWFSDVWFDVKGTPQALNDKDARLRSAAYPFEVVYRLINMYSAKGDIVLDPFLGTGTTTAAAIVSGRNSIGYEIDPAMEKAIDRIKNVIVDSSRQFIRKRLAKHMQFVVERLKTKGGFKYENKHYGFPVMTAQEKELIINDPIKTLQPETGMLEVEYSDKPQSEFCKNWSEELKENKLNFISQNLRHTVTVKKFGPNGAFLKNLPMDTEALRESYKPFQIKLLFVGESPPASGKFFYHKGAMTTFTSRAFEKVFNRVFSDTHSFLNFFRLSGCYLEDMCLEPVDKMTPKERTMRLKDSIEYFSSRLKEYSPEAIVIVLKRIESHVKEALKKAKISCPIYTLPFPGFGHQKNYIKELCKILQNHLK